MIDTFPSALLISAGLALIMHRYAVSDLLMRHGFVRQFGLIGREEKPVSRGVVLIGGLALVITGMLRLVS